MASSRLGAYTIFTGQNNPHNFTEWLSEEDMFRSYLVAMIMLDEVSKLTATEKTEIARLHPAER